MASEFWRESFIDVGRLGSKSVAFSTSVTATDTDTALTPTTGKRFRLKGFSIHATVTTVLAGTGVCLFLCDMASADSTFATSKVIWPIGGFAANAAAGTIIRNDTLVVYMPLIAVNGNGTRVIGYRSSAVNNLIKVSPNATLSTGAIQVSGTLFYDEES